MTKNFKETNIPESFSAIVADKHYMVGASFVDRIAKTLFHGTSKCLGAIKSMENPKAIVFRTIDNSFLCGAKVEYIPNESNPTDPAAGRWDYVWTTFEEDLQGSHVLEVNSNTMAETYFASSAHELFNMKFAEGATILFMNVIAELLIKWCKENCTDKEDATVEIPGVFQFTGTVENGEAIVSIVPGGEMKVLIKDDSAIQN